MNRADILDLFAYTEWANRLVLDACAQLADAELRAERANSHGSILGTLAHMAGAEWIWLQRWQQQQVPPNVWQMWAPGSFVDLPALRVRWHEVERARASHLAALDDATLQMPLSFRRLDGTPTTLPVIAQMQHTVNHATHHRGQVVGMLRQLGRTPPSTDLLVYYRIKTGQ